MKRYFRERGALWHAFTGHPNREPVRHCADVTSTSGTHGGRGEIRTERPRGEREGGVEHS